MSKKYFCSRQNYTVLPIGWFIVTCIFFLIGVIMYLTGVLKLEHGVIELLPILAICYFALVIPSFIFGLRFVSFSNDKICYYNHMLFGIPIKKEYNMSDISRVDIHYYCNYENIEFYQEEKCVRSVNINNYVLEAVMKYVPFEKLKLVLSYFGRVSRKQQELLTPLLTPEQSSRIDRERLFWIR